MQLSRAKEILSVLADGINPITGELLPDDSVCNEPEVIRAFCCILANLEKEQKQTFNSARPFNSGKPWLPEDDTALREMYAAGCGNDEICAHFGRSVRSIAARLVRLGVIAQREQFTNRKE